MKIIVSNWNELIMLAIILIVLFIGYGLVIINMYKMLGKSGIKNNEKI